MLAYTNIKVCRRRKGSRRRVWEATRSTSRAAAGLSATPELPSAAGERRPEHTEAAGGWANRPPRPGTGIAPTACHVCLQV